MIHTVRVAGHALRDPAGDDLAAEARRSLQVSGLEAVRTARVYRLEGVTGAEASRLGATLLAESVDHHYTVDRPIMSGADQVVEVGYLPGVMNPEASSILRAARDLGIAAQAVDSSREYAFYGDIDRDSVQRIIQRLLVNPTIQWVIDAPPETLLIHGLPGETRIVSLGAMDDAGLTELSAAGLHLDLDEMRAIQRHFAELGRDPTDLELEVLAQTWSEHCKHKTFKSPLVINGVRKRSLMARLMETAREYPDLVVSAFEDNSGVMRFFEGWAVCGKVETHNSPSAIEPYGGAMTGTGGVFRDVLGTGQGARVIASTDMFCLAPPDLPDDAVPPGALRPDYLLRRVVAGVRDYGNRMGVPTNNGSVHFHADFRAKPTVIVGAYGIMPEDLARKREPAAGDRIVALGGRTGRDGIHGATFSSTSMTASTIEVNATAVQIGNAVEEKRLLDAVLACRDAGLVRAITDCGAGGFSSAVGEMGERLGADVQLARVPLKYPGLAPWEIFISESQERMVLAVAPSDVDEVISICATYNVEASDIGSFEPTGRLVVRYGDQVAGQLSMAFLHDGLPIKEREGVWQAGSGDETLPRTPSSPAEWAGALRAVLSHPTVASKEPIARQYDHTVQGTAVVGPYGGHDGNAPSDGAVLAPLLGSEAGLVIAHGLNPVLNTFDPYWGGIWAAAEAMSNYVAVGGNPREACLIDNFIWPSPTPEALGGLDRALDACIDIMRALKRPFISGKDSLSSTYRHPDGSTIEIPPVLCVSVFGRMDSVRAACTAEFKSAGSEIALVGVVDTPATGGSIYLETCGLRGNRPPRVDLARLSEVLQAVHTAISSGAVLACHDVSQGGLVVAASEMGFGGTGIGAEIDLAVLEGRPDLAAFNETSGVFLVEMAPGQRAREVFPSAPAVVLGRTTADGSLTLKHGTLDLCRLALDELEASWRRPLAEVFH